MHNGKYPPHSRSQNRTKLFDDDVAGGPRKLRQPKIMQSSKVSEESLGQRNTVMDKSEVLHTSTCCTSHDFHTKQNKAVGPASGIARYPIFHQAFRPDRKTDALFSDPIAYNNPEIHHIVLLYA